MAVFSFGNAFAKIFGFRNPRIPWSTADSYSGKSVTGQTALSISTVFACVRLISQSIASLPCGLFTLDQNGDRVLSADSELINLLSTQPNYNMTAFDFWQVVCAHILLWGNSYNLKTYTGSGASKRCISMEPLLPELMALRANNDGSLTYVYSDPAGTEEYSEEEILHFKGFGMSGRIGLSVIGFARQSFGNALAMEESSGRLFSNGMRPGGAISLPAVLTKIQRDDLRKNILDQVSGVAKSGGTIVLEGGMEYKPLSMPPEDAQLMESRSFSVEEICRWFGVHPILIGHSAGTTAWGTGIEQINLGFLTYTLTPLIKKIEQEIRRSVISVKDRVKTFASFNVNEFLRSDSVGRAALYSSGAQNGWIKRSEIRRLENLPFVPGSDKLTVQSALIELDAMSTLDRINPSTVADSVKL